MSWELTKYWNDACNRQSLPTTLLVFLPCLSAQAGLMTCISFFPFCTTFTSKRPIFQQLQSKHYGISFLQSVEETVVPQSQQCTCSLQAMSYKTFVQLYEKPRIPVVITGLQDSWRAQQLWNTADLERRFGEHKFKASTVTFAALHSCFSCCSRNILHALVLCHRHVGPFQLLWQHSSFPC